jgi:hypothetical protein
MDYRLFRVMRKRHSDLFEQAQRSILRQLEEQGVDIPSDLAIQVPDLEDFNVFDLVSDYEYPRDEEELFQRVKNGMLSRLETMERFFSLQVAVDYCAFLMSCAYALNHFTTGVPTVGSDPCLATLTPQDGFQFVQERSIIAPAIRIP